MKKQGFLNAIKKIGSLWTVLIKIYVKEVFCMRLSQEEYKLIVDFSPNMIWRAGLDAKCNF